MENSGDLPEKISTFQLPPFSFDLVALDVVTSTNDIAKFHCEQEKRPVIVTAETQTEGRGSHGRKWISDIRGNVYLSVGIPQKKTVEFLTGASVRLAQEIADRVRNQWGVRLSVKHPNDLLLNGVKVGGILIECFPTTPAIIFGMGLNLVHSFELQCQCSQPVGAIAQVLPLERNHFIPFLASAVISVWTGKQPPIRR